MHPIRVHWLRREGSGHTRVDGDVRCGVVRVMRSSMKAFRRAPSRSRCHERQRRNDFMPESMIWTTRPLPSWSAPLCPLPSPRNRWPMYGTHGDGSTRGVDDPGAVDSYAPASRPSRQPIDGPKSILGQPLACLRKWWAPVSCIVLVLMGCCIRCTGLRTLWRVDGENSQHGQLSLLCMGRFAPSHGQIMACGKRIDNNLCQPW